MMRSRVIIGACCVSAQLLGAHATSGQIVPPDAEGFSIASPEDLMPAEGSRQVVLFGNPREAGLYVVRITFGPGQGSRPHFHNQARHITVMKGTWWVSTGARSDVYDPEYMRRVEAGSFIYEPPDGHHYDMAKDEEVTVQIMGMGPVVTTGIEATLPTARGGEWKTLFDGSSLDGWRALGTANWELGNGAVTATSGSGLLVSEDSYDDFQLKLEFWVDEPANSGVFIRGADPQRITDRNSYEVNIYDTRADQTYRTGGIVNVAAPSAMINAGGQWNTFEIHAQGSELIVNLNGTQTVATNDDQHPSGPFALQYAAGTVRFRNVQIRSLD